MTQDLATLLRETSPEGLRLYKQDLRQRLKTMRPEDRQSTLERLRGYVELTDVLGEFERIPEEIPLEMQGL